MKYYFFMPHLFGPEHHLSKDRYTGTPEFFGDNNRYFKAIVVWLYSAPAR